MFWTFLLRFIALYAKECSFISWSEKSETRASIQIPTEIKSYANKNVLKFYLCCRLHAFFYKQHFYKQQKAENRQKLSKHQAISSGSSYGLEFKQHVS